MSIAKDIIIDELNEDVHPEKVEDVIFWALEAYSKREQNTWGKIISRAIIDRILKEEGQVGISKPDNEVAPSS